MMDVSALYRRATWGLLVITALLLVLVPAVGAQETVTEDMGTVQRNVTDDEVNEIAKDLYCPVCENIPLDACGTAACEDWRYEIRLQLEAGMTRQEIIDDFINRFGDRVVGTPRDPILRNISLVTPWVLAVVALGMALYTIIQWQRPEVSEPPPADTPENAFRSQVEQDLMG